MTEEQETLERTERERPFIREYYVFDLERAGRLVVSSASAYRQSRAQTIFDVLLGEDREEWETYLKSYEMTPAIADSSLGRVILLPYLMPSASLALVLFPDIKGSDLLKLALRDSRPPILLGERLCSSPKGRLHDPTGCLRERYDRFMNLLERCYAHAEFGVHECPCEIGRLLSDRVESLSELLRVPVRWKKRTRVMNYGEVDEGLFLAYVTVILILAKNETTVREVVFTVEERSYGCSVSVMLDGMSRVRGTLEDLFWMDQLASKKRVLFELTKMPDGLFLHFSPMSRDWSYLGLKQDAQYDYGK